MSRGGLGLGLGGGGPRAGPAAGGGSGVAGDGHSGSVDFCEGLRVGKGCGENTGDSSGKADDGGEQHVCW